jgi:hypothetical protein
MNENKKNLVKEPIMECEMSELDKTKTVRPRGTDEARVIKVIETRSIRGFGTQDDICREVKQYWDFDGNLLAEHDPILSERFVQSGDVLPCNLQELK